ncbi:MAG: hypothetical protein LBT50_03620 [Prevotellaceae bacterium]|jgi:hypothetical protein|nr:hypothetical protein [Prevotellaceae bacterium]
MEVKKERNYKCKDEELTVICRNVRLVLGRDLPDFSAYSPIFNDEYVNDFGNKIDSVDELITPKIETDELKKITKRLYKTVDDLVDPITKIRGYLRLAKDNVGLSAKDFGLTLLLKKINAKDAEGIRQNLLVVNAYLNKYGEALVAVGMTNDVFEQFKDAIAAVTDDNKRQFEIVSNRKAIVQNNLNVLNGLYNQLMEILNIGKLLYHGKDALKEKEYTFATLLKSVRIVKTTKKEEKK